MKALKKILTLVCVGTLAAVIGLLAACDGNTPTPEPGPEPTPEITVKLDKSTLTLDENTSGTLNATVTGTDAALTAQSSNTGVATVAVSGKVVTVSALAAGSSTVTVSVGGKSATCAVTVNAVAHEPDFALSTEYVVLEDGYTDNDETADISVMEVDVTYTGDETVTCEIADEEIATATYASGKVTLTAVGTGKTTLTVSAGDDSKTCTVEVATFGLVYGNVLDGEETVMEVSDSDRRTSTDVYIPGYYWFEDDEAYYPVTQIKSATSNNGGGFDGDGAFTNSNIVSVYAGDNVSYVGGKAFKDCSALETVRFGAALRTIDGYAFNGCSALTTVNWGDSNLDRINRVAFNSCTALTEFTIPASVTGIGDDMFNGCTSLKKVRILGDITKLWGQTFLQCLVLEEVWWPVSLVEINNWDFGLYAGMPDEGRKMTIQYAGTEEQWNAITVNGGLNDTVDRNANSKLTVNFNADFDALLEAENSAD